jgi:hypothetical protein
VETRRIVVRDGGVGALNGLGVGLLIGMLTADGSGTSLLVATACTVAGALAAAVLGLVLEASSR